MRTLAETKKEMYSKEQLLEFYRTMVRIRTFEEKAAECFTKGMLAGNIHLSIGQEAAEAGAFAAIGPQDYFTSTHRGHGHAIARGADPKLAMAELFGKKTGYCKGKGGSMHIADMEKMNHLGANGIVGGGQPISAGSALASKILGLNIVNMIFLFLGILLHGDLRRYVDAISDAAGGAAGVLLQFPFYAGIMGMMVAANAEGVSLAGVISEFFVNISNNVTFPMLSFLAAGVVNFFVPSGGGQWAVQGPIMMPAGAAMGIENGRTAMAIAWGDQWTNMIQPFWALPALGIAKLSARDIMGYLVIVTLFVGVVACLGFLAWAAWF